jgi:enoyl-CoA hydratase/carnithine racemase
VTARPTLLHSIMEATSSDGADRHPHGEVRADVMDEHILLVTVDRVEKKNAFTPKITAELEDALTRLDEDPELFIGVLTFAGDHTTAGLEMPLFFTEEARRDAAVRRANRTSEPVDPFSLGRRLTKPRITAVQGITFTIGIEIALGGDVVVAASDLRMCQMEPRRGLAPLGGATVRYVQRAGWGNAMYHLLRADEFDAAEAYRMGLVQEVVEPGTQGARAIELAREMLQCSPVALRHTIANARLALDEDEPAALTAIPAMAEAVQATEDFQEGIASFVERRPAKFTGR